MSITSVTKASPELLPDSSARVLAALEMLCKHLGRMEERTELWLRRETEMEWMRDGKLDSQLLGLDRDVEVWRDYPPSCGRVTRETWRTVNISMSNLSQSVVWHMNEPHRNETCRLKTLEAMARLGLPAGTQHLRVPDLPLKCKDVGLDSDFECLAQAVSEEMMRTAVENEKDLTGIAYASPNNLYTSPNNLNPSLFLETAEAKSPLYWIGVGSRLFDSCGIKGGALRVCPLFSDVMRVVVPYHRSRRAAPDKRDTLLTQSKAIFEQLCRDRGRGHMEHALRDSDFADADMILSQFFHMP